jgi:hypothetical protein
VRQEAALRQLLAALCSCSDVISVHSLTVLLVSFGLQQRSCYFPVQALRFSFLQCCFGPDTVQNLHTILQAADYHGKLLQAELSLHDGNDVTDLVAIRLGIMLHQAT